jgi:glycosyltransferase involved in cell wall biosynthesis
VIADGPGRFAEAVVALLKNPERRRELGARACENVRRSYDWDRNLGLLEGLFS